MGRNKNDLFEKIEDDLRKIISNNISVDTSSIDDKKLEENSKLNKNIAFQYFKNNRYDNSAFKNDQSLFIKFRLKKTIKITC